MVQKRELLISPYALLNPGDTALITDPGYPVYSIGTNLVGGRPYYLPISPKNNFLPELDKNTGKYIAED